MRHVQEGVAAGEQPGVIDAFVVRMTPVPAAMALLGRRARHPPRRLDRTTPAVDIEAHVRNLDVAGAVIRPAAFMELPVTPETGPDRGHLSFLMRPDQAMQFIAVRDIGRIVAVVLRLTRS
ncbi:hypothetical protein ACFU5P_06205 [Streptomyces sp. NPDC057433]|uniref:hypothetical protein n=1 Tax=Streptomyces sp. NPDC057433 TaxID=3346132 RepID=UPI003689874B